MSYKVVNKNARLDQSGKHNDRNFDLNLDGASHIHKDRIKDNIYWNFIDGETKGYTEMTFKDFELSFYEQHFSQVLEEQHKKNKMNRNQRRDKTVEQYYKGAYTRPEDKILQIGNRDEHPDPRILWACVKEYIDTFNDRFGDKCKILDAALHLDEATPHVHLRRVWIAEDENGVEFVSQRKALEQLGFINNDRRYDNAKKRFTEIDMGMFYQICEKYIDIEYPTHERKQESKSIKQFKIDKDVERFKNFVTEQYDRGENFDSEKFVTSSYKIYNNLNNILNSTWIINLFEEEELRELRKKSKEDQIEAFAKRIIETSARNIQHEEDALPPDEDKAKKKDENNYEEKNEFF